jgi:hypothetical protein
VIDVRRIEVDGLLDPAQAERLGEEVVVFLGIRGHRGDVVEAFDLGEHGLAPVGSGLDAPVSPLTVSLDAQDAHRLTEENRNNLADIIAQGAIMAAWASLNRSTRSSRSPSSAASRAPRGSSE